MKKMIVRTFYGGIGFLTIIAGVGHISVHKYFIGVLSVFYGILILPLPFYRKIPFWLENVIKTIILLFSLLFSGILLYYMKAHLPSE